MKINRQERAHEITLGLEGRLDTTTAPMLEAELKHSIVGADTLIFLSLIHI